MNFSAETQDPHCLVVNVLNLIEHPFKQDPKANKKGDKSKTAESNIALQKKDSMQD